MDNKNESSKNSPNGESGHGEQSEPQTKASEEDSKLGLDPLSKSDLESDLRTEVLTELG